MRILFISTTFPDASAPARGTYNSALCRELARIGSVRVIAPRSFTESVPRKLRGKSYQTSDLISDAGIYAEFPTYWYTPKVWQEFSGDQMWWSVKSQVTCAIQQFQPDAVLSYWAHPEGEVGLRAAREAGVPCAVIVGGTDVLVLPNLPKRGPKVQRVLTQSDAVITVSDGLREAVIGQGVDEHRVRTIYQGIEPDVFNQTRSRAEARKKLKLSEDRSHLVWVGRMHPIKALPVLIEAVSILKKGDIKFQLNLIGNGPDQKRVEQLVEQYGLQNEINFVGAVGHDQIANWYRAADLTALSSNSEGLPNVLRESLACGTPFVSTDVGSIREITDETFSRLAENGNAESLAAAIQEALQPGLREAASNYVARTWQDTATEVYELFQSLIDNQRAASKPAKVSTQLIGS